MPVRGVLTDVSSVIILIVTFVWAISVLGILSGIFNGDATTITAITGPCLIFLGAAYKFKDVNDK